MKNYSILDGIIFNLPFLNFRFVNKNSLQNHVSSVHLKDQIFTCEQYVSFPLIFEMFRLYNHLNILDVGNRLIQKEI